MIQQSQLDYTWEGIIDFLSFHKSILKEREDIFDKEKENYNTRIIQLEQEVGNLKRVNEKMSSKISELEIKLGMHQKYLQRSLFKNRFKQDQQQINKSKQKNHSRVKSDLVQNFDQTKEESQCNQSIGQKQISIGQNFYARKSSTSLHQKGDKVLSSSNTQDGITGQSLVLQFLQNIGYDNRDLSNEGNKEQSPNNFLQFDNKLRLNQQLALPVNNTEFEKKYNSSYGIYNNFEQGQNENQKKRKNSSGKYKNAIIQNQTALNSINSNNFFSAYNVQQMQINQTPQNNFIQMNKSLSSPHQQQTNFTNTVISSSPNKSITQKVLQQSQQVSQQQNIHPYNKNNYKLIQFPEIGSNFNSSQKQSKLKTNNLQININEGSIQPSIANSVASTTNSTKNIMKSLLELNVKNQNAQPQTPKSMITTNSTSPHANSDSSNENRMIRGKKIWNPKFTLRSHLDGVRGLFFTAIDPILATASEDCLIKLWDTRKFKEHKENLYIQPYHTIRGHNGQIFTITGNQQEDNSTINFQCYNFLFSAGYDGVIKAWNLPLPEEIDTFGQSTEGKNGNVGEWQAHHEAIWDLNHHPQKPILLSSGADGFIKLWKTFASVEGTALVSLQQRDLISELSYKPGQFLDIPTSVAWDHQRASIISGWVQSNNLVTFSTENSKISGILKFNQDSSWLSSQVNKLICHEGINCAISGHEDKQIRFFDLKSNSLIKNLIGHTDAVTSLSIHPNQYYMSSVGHDGSMRTWDIRKYQCIHDIPVHKRKFDESVHTVLCHQKLPLIATGGADGLVKIFNQQEII